MPEIGKEGQHRVSSQKPLAFFNIHVYYFLKFFLLPSKINGQRGDSSL